MFFVCLSPGRGVTMWRSDGDGAPIIHAGRSKLYDCVTL